MLLKNWGRIRGWGGGYLTGIFNPDNFSLVLGGVWNQVKSSEPNIPSLTTEGWVPALPIMPMIGSRCHTFETSSTARKKYVERLQSLLIYHFTTFINSMCPVKPIHFLNFLYHHHIFPTNFIPTTLYLMNYPTIVVDASYTECFFFLCT